jgi:hypothetical protein
MPPVSSNTNSTIMSTQAQTGIAILLSIADKNFRWLSNTPRFGDPNLSVDPKADYLGAVGYERGHCPAPELRPTADRVRFGRSLASRRGLKLDLRRLSATQFTAPLCLRIQLRAEQEGKRAQPEPGEHDDHCRQRSPGLVI